jgi:hypothetical protein
LADSLEDQVSEFMSWDYIGQTGNYSSITGDYSSGLTGTTTPAPEPAAAVMLLPAGDLLLRRRRAPA